MCKEVTKLHVLIVLTYISSFSLI